MYLCIPKNKWTRLFEQKVQQLIIIGKQTYNKLKTIIEHLSVHTTVCPRILDPFYIVKLLYKMGQDFLDRQYLIKLFLPGTLGRHIIHNIFQHFIKDFMHIYNILITKKTKIY